MKTGSNWLPAAIAAAILTSVVAEPALAHQGVGATGGFANGFVHPFLGLDHVIAMVAVGLWGAALGGSALWLLPLVFPLVMAAGGALAMSGLPLPAVEAGIAASAVVLGLAIAFALRPPLGFAAAIVGVFAVFHGHAHGAELPAAAGPAAYALGFVAATALLHLAGLASGTLARSSAGTLALRAGGGAIALGGLVLLGGLA